MFILKNKNYPNKNTFIFKTSKIFYHNDYYLEPYKPDYIKYYKPITPGVRHKVSPKSGSLLNIKVKALSIEKKAKAGRNHTGKITVRHRGGGHKRRIRIIDYNGNIGAYSKTKVLAICYDPQRTTRLALCTNQKHDWFWRLAADKQKAGDILRGKYLHGLKDFKVGEIVPVKMCPEGIKVYNIETIKGKGGQLARAAGTYATIIKHNTNNTTLLSLSSKKDININSDCVVSIGRASNIFHNNKILGKAGVSRWKGFRPCVRGEAMNPIDHPHGGKTRGGVRLRTVYGKLAKFVKTAK